MSEPSEARRVFGLILIVLGLLWSALSGLCTVFGLFITASMAFGPHGNLSALLLALAPGSVSILIGWLVWRGGRALRGVVKKPKIKLSDFE